MTMTTNSEGQPALAAAEFAALRSTIASRGTVRMLLAPALFVLWGALGLAVLGLSPTPLATLVPLVALVAGFEALLALHTGVERIGRFLQVFVEEARLQTDLPPLWETVSMASAPRMPGGIVDPLFTPVFVAAFIVNLALGMLAGVTTTEAVALGTVHLLALGRLLLARRAAAGQRARDLEHFRRLRHTTTAAGLDRHPSH